MRLHPSPRGTHIKWLLVAGAHMPSHLPQFAISLKDPPTYTNPHGTSWGLYCYSRADQFLLLCHPLPSLLYRSFTIKPCRKIFSSQIFSWGSHHRRVTFYIAIDLVNAYFSISIKKKDWKQSIVIGWTNSITLMFCPRATLILLL